MEIPRTNLGLGPNIACFRKKLGLTQAELAQKLNYSDKAVSKWERGEASPDAATLVALADLFGVTLDALLGRQEPRQAPKKEVSAGKILGLVSALVWLIAVVTGVMLSAFGIREGWLSLLYAVPVNALTALILCAVRRRRRALPILISVILWGCIASVFASLLIFAKKPIWSLFLIGVPAQAAVSIWFGRDRDSKEETHG